MDKNELKKIPNKAIVLKIADMISSSDKMEMWEKFNYLKEIERRLSFYKDNSADLGYEALQIP